ncbi:MAG: TetR/AcrR family transcriptional regulator [Proteobacteria bacterium]|nr:TetR/AcrR family transcriptional regulator [Pseudomonadota bacterium]
MSRRTAKTKKRNPGDVRARAIRAALDMAAAEGWGKVTPARIARKIKISLALLKDHFKSRYDILVAYMEEVDRQVLAAGREDGFDLSPRDRLFDLLMERFDVLNRDREGVRAVLLSMRCDPKQAVMILPHLCRSMGRMLDAAGAPVADAAGTVKITALTAIYLYVFRIWIEDESPDMAKTMATLDKCLGKAEHWAGWLGVISV